MSSLPPQPLQVSDFSGGITDNFIAGGPTRYLSADNFLVSVDRKLEERNGSTLLDLINYQLPSGNSPVNALISHDNENFLLGISTPNIYVLNPNWASILGPTGNPPLTGGIPTNQISSGEFSHHTLVTDDSLSTKPIKIYRGAALPTTFPAPTDFPPAPSGIGNFTAVTAGLPALISNPNISQPILLQNCINLANDLATQMIAHMGDFGSIGTNLHENSDTADIAKITAAGVATDLVSLLVLVSALISAYEPHVSDVIVNFFSPAFHFGVTGVQEPLNFHLSNTTPPTTLNDAATILDDLKTKFLDHELAVFTHDENNNYSVIGRHLVTTPHIGIVTNGPVLTPNYSQSIALANNMKAAYNAHIADATYHIISDTLDPVSIPDALDLDTLYILITHIRSQYAQHLTDANLAHNYSSTSVGNTEVAISSIVNQVTGQTYNPVLGNTIWDPTGSAFPKSSQIVTVTVTGTVGACHASIASSTSANGYILDFTPALFHINQVQNLSQNLGNLQALQFVTFPPDAANLSNWVFLLTQVITAFNSHDSDTIVHLVANMHQTSAAVPTIASYSYALHYFYQYMRYDGVIFDVEGPPLLLGPVQTETITPAYQTVDPNGGPALSVAASSLTITNIPALQNGGQDNYDINNVQIKIFRTIDAGSTFFQSGLISNGTSQFIDTLPDTVNPLLPATLAILSQPTLYTTGGVVNFDPAPISKYITVLNNTPYFAGIIDTGQTFLNRIRQGIQNQIDSAPGSFFIDLPDTITGISFTRNLLIGFCANSTYQVTGAFNSLGQGQLNYQAISDTIGCVSSESIVRTDVGIFFAGTDGFYYTDGFQVIKLSSEFNNTYLTLISNTKQKAAIYGCYDRYLRRVWWSTQPNLSDYSPTQSYIFHINYGVTANGVFTTASNGDSYRPSSMIFFQGKQIRGDQRGYLFYHSPLVKTDPQVNIQTSPLTWNTLYIPYNYASCALDFGTTFNRKWLTRMSFQSKNIGNVAVQVTSVSDTGRVPPLKLSPIWFHSNLSWGDPSLIWGNPKLIWDDRTEIDMWRRFPATQLRADYKQITMTPAKIGVYRYQDYPVGAAASIQPNGDGTATVGLLTPPSNTALIWPTDVVGYTFSQQSDNFTAEYPITSLINASNFLVSDPANALPSIQSAWVIRGILKQQKVSITSYVIHYSLLGKMQRAFQGAQDAGENAPGTFVDTSGHILDETSGFILDENGNPILEEN